MSAIAIIAAYIALSFTVGGLYAWGMARHRRAQQAGLAELHGRASQESVA